MKILNSFFVVVVVVVVVVVCVSIYIYIYNLSNKKCVYIIKKCVYIYIYVCESCLDKYISIALDPQIKIPSSVLRARGQSTGCFENQWATKEELKKQPIANSQ